jgi:nucleotide-binding universal stress UspA family protein
MFQRILIPLDGSPRAELILSQIARILRREDSDIILLRVVTIPETSRFEPARRMAYEVARGHEREEADRYVTDLARRLRDRGIRAHGSVAEGPPAPTILEKAKLEGATLIAMTTHGRGGLSRWFMGSVAEKVVRASPTPVLLVRSFRPTPLGDLQPARALELPFRKILVPTDGSAAAATMIGPAAEFAQLFDAEVMVLHAELPIVMPGYGEQGFPPALQATPSEQDRATAKAAGRFGDLGLPVKRRTIVGNAAEVILDVAHTEEVDLIAMATHGRSGFSRWVLGSVAERVLRHAGVPLLLVRAKKADRARAGGHSGRKESLFRPRDVPIL